MMKIGAFEFDVDSRSVEPILEGFLRLRIIYHSAKWRHHTNELLEGETKEEYVSQNDRILNKTSMFDACICPIFSS